MTERAWSRQERRALSSAARTVSRYLDEWDPIPVYDEPGGPAPGEYDDLVWPVMLVDGAPADDVADRLRKGLEDDYGIGCPANVQQVAIRLRKWWDGEVR